MKIQYIILAILLGVSSFLIGNLSSKYFSFSQQQLPIVVYKTQDAPPTVLSGSLSDVTIDSEYDRIIEKGCNLEIFEFQDTYFSERFIGASFGDFLILRSKSSDNFQCFKLETPIAGGSLFLINDYGTEIQIDTFEVTEAGKIIISDTQEQIKQHHKTKLFLSREKEVGGVFQGFFFAEQIKTSKINSLGIALFINSLGELKAYEFNDDEKLTLSKASEDFATCLDTDETIKSIFSQNDVFSQGIFKNSNIKISNTVFDTSRFYNSLINYFYKNYSKNVTAFSNDCFRVLK